MGKLISDDRGDGITEDRITFTVALPDTGSTVVVQGMVVPKGQTYQIFTGSPLTAPSPPGSGLIYWIIQVAQANGALSIKQSNSAMPGPDAGNDLVYWDIMGPTDTNLANDPNDQYVTA